jgi:hypothetical protein
MASGKELLDQFDKAIARDSAGSALQKGIYSGENVRLMGYVYTGDVQLTQTMEVDLVTNSRVYIVGDNVQQPGDYLILTLSNPAILASVSKKDIIEITSVFDPTYEQADLAAQSLLLSDHPVKGGRRKSKRKKTKRKKTKRKKTNRKKTNRKRRN